MIDIKLRPVFPAGTRVELDQAANPEVDNWKVNDRAVVLWCAETQVPALQMVYVVWDSALASAAGKILDQPLSSLAVPVISRRLRRVASGERS